MDLNRELVTHERLECEEDIIAVKELIYKHLERTESDRAKEILSDWNRYQSNFWKIRPINLPPVPRPAVVTPAVEATTSVAKS
jgi:glutamate synthase domain-containing protein 3